MPTISCFRCQRCEGHRVGSKDELQYMRVIDTTRNFGKVFFCSPSCYLDHVFISEVFARAHEEFQPIGLPELMTDKTLGPIYEALAADQYEQITQYAAASWGFRTYLKRLGLESFRRTQPRVWKSSRAPALTLGHFDASRDNESLASSDHPSVSGSMEGIASQGGPSAWADMI